jgi:hypothetical protein
VSKWIVYEGYSQLHVLPVDGWGVVVPPHVGHDECKCGPRPDPEQPNVIIHQDRERGGFNS